MLNKQENNKSTNTYANTSQLTGMFCLTTLKNDEWIIDSGATNHICNDLHKFLYYDMFKDRSHSITIPDGRTISIKYKGHVKLYNGLVLHDVLYVPQFRFNLISVSKIISDRQGFVSFDTNKSFLQETLKKKTHLLGKLTSGLYIRHHTYASATSEYCNQTTSKTVLHKAKLWHLRLGHLPISRLEFLFPKISENLIKSQMFCTIYPLGK